MISFFIILIKYWYNVGSNGKGEKKKKKEKNVDISRGNRVRILLVEVERCSTLEKEKKNEIQ